MHALFRTRDRRLGTSKSDPVSIATTKNRALDIGARGRHRCKFACQIADDLQLAPGEVSAFIHKDMVDATVEAKQNPLRKRLGRQRARVL